MDSRASELSSLLLEADRLFAQNIPPHEILSKLKAEDPTHSSLLRDYLAARSGLRDLLSHRGVALTLPDLELEECLGSGGVALVYRARQLDAAGRKVAVKVLGADLLPAGKQKLFDAEVQALSSLRHSRIVTLYYARRLQSVFYLVLEYASGGTLADFLEILRSGKKPPFPWAEGGIKSRNYRPRILAEFASLCDALAYSHRHGVIHRDIKPGNIGIDEHGSFKLMDFGLAALRRPSFSAGLKEAVGTLRYSSPEVLLEGRCTEQSDIYSLAVTLLEALTLQKPPFPPARVNLPRSLGHNLRACLSKALSSPEKRYHSAEEFAEDLRSVSKGVPVGPERKKPFGFLLYVARKRPKTTAALLALCIITAALCVRVAAGAFLSAWVDNLQTQTPDAMQAFSILRRLETIEGLCGLLGIETNDVQARICLSKGVLLERLQNEDSLPARSLRLPLAAQEYLKAFALSDSFPVKRKALYELAEYLYKYGPAQAARTVFEEILRSVSRLSEDETLLLIKTEIRLGDFDAARALAFGLQSYSGPSSSQTHPNQEALLWLAKHLTKTPVAATPASETLSPIAAGNLDGKGPDEIILRGPSSWGIYRLQGSRLLRIAPKEEDLPAELSGAYLVSANIVDLDPSDPVKEVVLSFFSKESESSERYKWGVFRLEGSHLKVLHLAPQPSKVQSACAADLRGRGRRDLFVALTTVGRKVPGIEVQRRIAVYRFDPRSDSLRFHTLVSAPDPKKGLAWSDVPSLVRVPNEKGDLLYAGCYYTREPFGVVLIKARGDGTFKAIPILRGHVQGLCVLDHGLALCVDDPPQVLLQPLPTDAVRPGVYLLPIRSESRPARILAARKTPRLWRHSGCDFFRGAIVHSVTALSFWEPPAARARQFGLLCAGSRVSFPLPEAKLGEPRSAIAFLNPWTLEEIARFDSTGGWIKADLKGDGRCEILSSDFKKPGRFWILGVQEKKELHSPEPSGGDYFLTTSSLERLDLAFQKYGLFDLAACSFLLACSKAGEKSQRFGRALALVPQLLQAGAFSRALSVLKGVEGFHAASSRPQEAACRYERLYKFAALLAEASSEKLNLSQWQHALKEVLTVKFLPRAPSKPGRLSMRWSPTKKMLLRWTVDRINPCAFLARFRFAELSLRYGAAIRCAIGNPPEQNLYLSLDFGDNGAFAATVGIVSGRFQSESGAPGELPPADNLEANCEITKRNVVLDLLFITPEAVMQKDSWPSLTYALLFEEGIKRRELFLPDCPHLRCSSYAFLILPETYGDCGSGRFRLACPPELFTLELR